MSVYTTQLRYICERYAGKTKSVDYSETPAVIAAARPRLFDFPYPIYDASYKPVLETKIINHFYFREIGAETAAQFKFMLARTLNEIMPAYNQLYESAAMDFNPFYDADYYTDHKGSGSGSKQSSSTGKTTSSGSSSGTDRSVNSGGISKTKSYEEERTPDLTKTDTYNRDDKRTLNTQDQETINTTDTKTLNTQNQTTFNTTDTETRALKDTTRRSDTPQGSLQNIENNTYLTEAQIVDGTGTDTKKKTGTQTDNQTGTETTTHTGTDTVARTGTDDLKMTGTVTGTETGTDTTSYAGTESETDTRQNTLTKSDTTSGNTTNTGSGTESYSDTDSWLNHIYGKTPGRSYMELIREWRENIINIDMMIIKELEICFMNIY